MIATELIIQRARPRTVVTLASLAGFGVLLAAALLLAGSERAETVGDIPLRIVPSQSGYALPLIALSSTMKFFLPLAVAILAGESVAGQAAWGSLRYALARGIPRTRVLVSSVSVAALLSLLAVVLVPAASLLVGLIVFGGNPLRVVDASTASPLTDGAAATFGAGAALSRLALATAYVAAGMSSVFAVALFLSTVTSRAVVAVAGGVGVTIVSRVLNADYLPGVGALAPYMPNNDVDLWQHLFQQPAQTEGMLHFILLQLGYVAVFGTLAWAWFRRRDVLE